MRWMGEYLSGRGYSVLGVRLFGHATRPEDMLRARWQDWVASVEDGYHLLSGAAKHIFVMGLSMGGVLSLLFSAQQRVDGVVAMSTPYQLRDDPRLRFLRILSRLQPVVPKGPPDWRNPEAALDHVDYPYYPTLSIEQLSGLLEQMRLSLPQVKVPVLLAHARGDTGGGGFHPESMQRIYDTLGSKDKHMLWVENSGHVITREPERMRVFQAADEFIQRVSAHSRELAGE
jgi:carboxylesterase